MKIAYTVALYETNRAYGGPEEGGWWYDYGTRDAEYGVHAFATKEEAQAFVEANEPLVADLNREQGRRQPGSVLCDGWLVLQWWEGIAPTSYPAERPRYE